MSSKDMSMRDLNKAYYARRLRMKQKWYKKNADDVANYNQKYYKKNIKPNSRSSRKGSRKSSRKSSRRHSRHISHKTKKSPEQVDKELTMMIKRLMILKEKNKQRLRSRK